MAHEITQNAITGLMEFAYRADHGMPWHGEGQAVSPDQFDNVEEWKTQAGMQWKANRSRVRYGEGAQSRIFDDHHVLFRSDTKAPLSIVSKGYKIVQPGEMVDFFRDILGVGGLEMSACGTLFGGRELWATAKMGTAAMTTKDHMHGFVLIHTSLDGSFATTVRRVVERAVCKNTVRMAFGEKQAKGSVIKVTHRSVFDADQVRGFMGLNKGAWEAAKAAMLRLANTPVTDNTAADLTLRLLAPGALSEPAPTAGVVHDRVVASAGYGKILALFGGEGKGSKLDGVAGTAWGFVNAVTEYADHHVRAQSAQNRWSSAQFGAGSDLKDRALALVA